MISLEKIFYLICIFLIINSCDNDSGLDDRIVNFYGHWDVIVVSTVVQNDSIIAEKSWMFNYNFKEDYTGNFYRENNPNIDSIRFDWDYDLINDKLTRVEFDGNLGSRKVYSIVTNSFDRIVYTEDSSFSDTSNGNYQTLTYKLDRSR